MNELYKVCCAKWRGAEGKGDGETLTKLKRKCADWTDKTEMKGLTDQYLFDIVWQGGVGVGKSKIMPVYKAKLKGAEAKEFVPFVRSFAK